MSIDKLLPLPPLEANSAADLIATVLKSEVNRAGFNKVVLGLSGGIDSALSLALAVKALGNESVLAIRMPYESSSPDSLEHAALICKELGVSFETINITGMVEGLVDQIPDCQGLRKGNVMARARMITLYDFSAAKNADGNFSKILKTRVRPPTAACSPFGRSLAGSQTAEFEKRDRRTDGLTHKRLFL